MPESPLATPAEVAEYLRTTTARLSQQRYHGTGPKFVRDGRRVIYRWEDVKAYVEANTLQRTDDRPAAV
jgi:hypothetical protein